MRRQDALDLLRMYHEAAAAPGPWENEPLPPELSVLGAESDRGDVVGVDSDDGSGGVLEQENAVENKEGKRDALVGTASRDESRDKEEEDKGGNAVREVKQEVNDEDGQEIADDWSDGALEEELQELQLVADLHYLLQQQQQHAGSENRTNYDNGNELLVTVSETASVGGGYGKVGFQEPLRPAFYDAAEDGEGGYTEQFAQLRVHAAASVGRAASVASAATSARAGRVASAARTTSVARVGSGAASAARLRPVLPAAAEDGAGSTEQPVPLQNHSSSGAASAVTSSTAASASNAASAVSVRPVLPALYDAAEDGIGFTEQFAQMKLKAKGRREEEFSSIATAVTSSTAVTAATAATAATAVTAATASSASSAATAATSSTAATAFNAAGAVSMRPVLPALYDTADDGIGFTEQFAQMRVKVKGRRDEDPACFVVAYAYIDRILQEHDDMVITSLNVHRLLITCIMVAAKFLDDSYFNNAYYAKVGGVTTAEMNRLEMELLFRMDFRLNITTDVFYAYCKRLEAEIWNSRPPFEATLDVNSLSMLKPPGHLARVQPCHVEVQKGVRTPPREVESYRYPSMRARTLVNGSP
ncbi:unnamed protein product [Closterium sp. Naga37s-1]|nr:unnamed protein product [Closterium sp. Naga37s-1]